MNIKKIIREEIESSDWDWVKDVPNNFELGSFFNDDDVCFDSDSDCIVNINKDNITFVLDWDWWLKKHDVYSDNERFLETLFYNGRNYSGDGDYLEVDMEEFNYSSYQISDEQRRRFQNILDIVGSGVDIDKYISNDNMLNLSLALKYKPLREYYNNLIDDYLGYVGYAVERNRWLDISEEFGKQIDKTKSEWRLYRDELTITVPMNVVWENFSTHSIGTLSDLLYKVSSPITDQAWYDWFYENWDTSGAEDKIEDSFNNFLDKAEEFLDDAEEVKVYKNFHDIIDGLGFEPFSDTNTKLFYLWEPKTTQYWTLIPNYNTEKALLELKKGTHYGSSEKSFEIPFEEIPNYVNNYRLEL
jgi:hypothetical protein